MADSPAKTWIVLLRGINVGGNNILPMKDLVSLMETQGYREISTYIQSGNVVARAARPSAEKLAAAIHESFGFAPVVLLLEKAALENAIALNPYKAGEGKAVHFFFCADAPKPDRAKIAALKRPSEDVSIKNRVMYLHAPDGIGRSTLVANVETCLGVTATGRNLNTVLKLRDMAGKL